MNRDQCWRLVTPSLPSEVAREVNESKEPTKTMADQIKIVSDVMDRSAWPIWRDVLYQWARKQTRSSDMMRSLADLDRRLAVWCSCVVARSVMRFVPDGESGPRLAIEAAEGWVYGAENEEACWDASEAAEDAYFRAMNGRPASYQACMAASYASLAACCTYDFQQRPAFCAQAAVRAEVAAVHADDFEKARVIHFNDSRLKPKEKLILQVIRDAIITMPWETTR